MSVRVCLWMGGIPQRARDGSAVMSMDVRYDAVPWMEERRMHRTESLTQGARKPFGLVS